jgi:hypothetical protein
MTGFGHGGQLRIGNRLTRPQPFHHPAWWAIICSKATK